MASALERAGGSVELLKELGALFLTELPLLMTTLREAIAAGDPNATERAAHKLKGCVGNFSAHPAWDAALKLEVLGRERCLSEAEPALAKLESEITRLKLAMTEFCSLEARP